MMNSGVGNRQTSSDIDSEKWTAFYSTTQSSEMVRHTGNQIVAILPPRSEKKDCLSAFQQHHSIPSTAALVSTCKAVAKKELSLRKRLDCIWPKSRTEEVRLTPLGPKNVVATETFAIFRQRMYILQYTSL